MSGSKPPTHGDWDCALETSQVYEAELAAGRLREAGIECRIIDQSYRQEPVPSVRSFSVVRLLVPAESVLEAKRVLAEPAGLQDDGDTEDT